MGEFGGAPGTVESPERCALKIALMRSISNVYLRAEEARIARRTGHRLPDRAIQNEGQAEASCAARSVPHG
jgi:hypothetical protein